MEETYDVIVVGAGFGGPVAAKKCADAGLKTLLLERSARVGEKVISGLTIPFYGFLFGPAFIRDGNPPVERPVEGIINYIVKDIDRGEIEIDDSLRIPRPLSPVLCLGYNAYCRPFCQWEADRAVESGVELRTSITVTDLYREDGRVAGVVTEDGRVIRARVVIDAEGSQGLLAVKAGVRKKYPPDVISLADVYDYRMDKEKVDRVLGFSNRFVWAWDEQRLAPPLGFGNGLMVWPYRGSIHFMQDQCLKMERGGRTPNLAALFREYHRNITSKLPWWRDEVAPHAELRAHMWDTFEIYVGLDGELRKMPVCDDGLLIIGDAAGLESTELCDGVPAAWFSAELAAETAVEAITKGDLSAGFLSRYRKKVEAHPLIRWSISGTNRYNLRHAQRAHDERLLRKYVHDGWGLGAFTHASTPLTLAALRSIQDDPMVITSWLRMFPRYFRNWARGSFDPPLRQEPVAGEERPAGGGLNLRGEKGMESVTIQEMVNQVGVPFSPARGTSGDGGQFAKIASSALRLLDAAVFFLGPALAGTARLLEPLARWANPVVTTCLPLLEMIMKAIRKAEPFLAPLSEGFQRRLAEA